MPHYDGGAFIQQKMQGTSVSCRFRVWESIAWVGSAMLNEGHTLLECEARVRLNVARVYEPYVQPYAGYEPAGSIRNSTTALTGTASAPRIRNAHATTSSRRECVGPGRAGPNPYYSFSGYETSRLDNRVKFINLRSMASMSITTWVALVRRYRKDNDLTYLDWDEEREQCSHCRWYLHQQYVTEPRQRQRPSPLSSPNQHKGGRRFVDITASSGTGELHKGHGVSFADIDGDGDCDIAFEVGGATPGDAHAFRLFANPGHGRDWLGLDLGGHQDQPRRHRRPHRRDGARGGRRGTHQPSTAPSRAADRSARRRCSSTSASAPLRVAPWTW